MRHAKFFSILMFVAVLGYGAVGLYFLPMASFQGDLTRMGLLPELQFGWRKPQPAIGPELLRQSSLQEADVLVIGDSFSRSHVWQAVLTQHGIKVHTGSWGDMRAICTDFIPWLRAQGFRGRFVVLEIIERNVPDRLAESLACQHMRTNTRASADKPILPPDVSFDRTARNRDGRFSVGIRTALNLRNYERSSREPGFEFAALPNGVKVARVKNGCELFSHVRCEDALFYTEDVAGEPDSHTLKNIEKLNTRMEGITPIWAIVPNKSTTYLYPDKQFWNEAERNLRAPNLLRMTQQAIKNKVMDIYPANDTHFSTTGYWLMGEEIFKTMQQAGFKEKSG